MGGITMRQQKKSGTPSDHDYWEVSKAANNLINQACTLGARHIKDGTLRIQFNREVAYYAKNIVDDVAQGSKTPEQGMKDIKNEQNNLLSQSREVTTMGAGAIAGAFQFATNNGIGYGSISTPGLFAEVSMMAHGANNQDPVRKDYPPVTKAIRGNELEGNRAYAVMDSGLSTYGAGRMVLKPDAWRLFRYVNTDHVRAHNTSGKKAPAFDYPGEPRPVLQANRAAPQPSMPAATATACD